MMMISSALKLVLPAVCFLAVSFTSTCCAATTKDEDRPTTMIQASLGEYTTVTTQIKPFRFLAHIERVKPNLPPVNAELVDLLLTYPRDAKHEYWWPKAHESQYDGSTTDVVVHGIRAMRGEKKARTFCCGLTLELVLRQLDEELRSAAVLTTQTVPLFKRLWFCDEIYAPGPVDALVGFGMGRSIKPDNAKAGDFVQIWRGDRSGHSVVFIAWAHNPKGKRVGLHYWSTQPGTDGIAFNSEMFGEQGKMVLEDKIGVARLLPPGEWSLPDPQDLVERYKP